MSYEMIITEKNKMCPAASPTREARVRWGAYRAKTESGWGQRGLSAGTKGSWGAGIRLQ